jgi:hypothetical protein
VAFDDRNTEPLIVVGCLMIICGVVAVVVYRRAGGWWCLLSFAVPVVIWGILQWLWRPKDRGGDRS